MVVLSAPKNPLSKIRSSSFRRKFGLKSSGKKIRMTKDKPTLDGDITHRVVLIFMHPKSKKDEPILCGLMIEDLIEYGPPTTKKGKPWIFVSTQIIH
jgi:hypothetical protein